MTPPEEVPQEEVHATLDCPVCQDYTDHVFERDSGNYEVYDCVDCGTEASVAVR